MRVVDLFRKAPVREAAWVGLFAARGPLIELFTEVHQNKTAARGDGHQHSHSQLPLAFNLRETARIPEGSRTAFRVEPEHHRSVATLAPATARIAHQRHSRECPLGIAAPLVVRREPALDARPLSFDFTHGHIVSLMLRDAPWQAAFDWSLAAVLWLLYFARLRRRTASLVCAIFLLLIPIPFVLHSVFAGGPVLEFAIFWIVAAFIWLAYFRQRPC